MPTFNEAASYVTAIRRDCLVFSFLEALATYARLGFVLSPSDGVVCGWAQSLSRQHTACLSVALHLHDQAVMRSPRALG